MPKKQKTPRWRALVRTIGKALALGVVRRYFRVARIQITIGAIALSGAVAGVRWFWRRRQSAQEATAT
jgi:hypothetical protein